MMWWNEKEKENKNLFEHVFLSFLNY